MVCDTDPRRLTHSIDRTTSGSYSDELTNTIGTSLVFPRVPCAIDGAGSSVPPITAAQVTDFTS